MTQSTIQNPSSPAAATSRFVAAAESSREIALGTARLRGEEILAAAAKGDLVEIAYLATLIRDGAMHATEMAERAESRV